MLACVDVDYRENEAIAACVLFADWAAESHDIELIERISPIADYEPGNFYKRELPCLLKVLKQAPAELDAVVIDGYVTLDETGNPGLGAHLYEALDQAIPIIGVAKSRYRHITQAHCVVRGDSQRPLFVTAVGLEVEEAARHIEAMHGPYRLPTLIKTVDRLCRQFGR